MKENMKQMVDYLAQESEHGNGLTCKELMLRLKVSRRTVERLRKTLIKSGYHIKYHTVAGEKSWRLDPGDKPPVTEEWNAEELAALHNAIDLLQQRGFAALGQLQRLERRIERHLSPAQKSRIDVDQYVLKTSERYIWPPSLKEELDSKKLDTIRRAILSTCKLRFRYPSRWEKGAYTLEAEPYGLLHKLQSYLLAKDYKGRLRLYNLRYIEDVSIMEQQYFVFDEEFSLDAYTKTAFGIFQGDGSVEEIALCFCPEVAAEACAFEFHPDQHEEHCQDGSYIVRFSVGISREICHHLFTWGNAVKILAPQSLRDSYGQLLHNALATLETPKEPED